MEIRMVITQRCQIFRGPSHPASVRLLTHWMQTIGCAPLRKSLRLLVLKKMIKFHLQLITLEVQLPYGGKIQKPCGRLMRKSPGKGLKTSSENIISLLELSRPSNVNFSHSSKEISLW